MPVHAYDLLLSPCDNLLFSILHTNVIKSHRNARLGQLDQIHSNDDLVKHKCLGEKITAATTCYQVQIAPKILKQARNVIAQKHFSADSLPEEEIRKIHIPEEIGLLEA